jgi:hypothetical protein
LASGAGQFVDADDLQRQVVVAAPRQRLGDDWLAPPGRGRWRTPIAAAMKPASTCSYTPSVASRKTSPAFQRQRAVVDVEPANRCPCARAR